MMLSSVVRSWPAIEMFTKGFLHPYGVTSVVSCAYLWSSYLVFELLPLLNHIHKLFQQPQGDGVGGKFWQTLTKLGKRVSQMLIIADKDVRGLKRKIVYTKANWKPSTFTFINTPHSPHKNSFQTGILGHCTTSTPAILTRSGGFWNNTSKGHFHPSISWPSCMT